MAGAHSDVTVPFFDSSEVSCSKFFTKIRTLRQSKLRQNIGIGQPYLLRRCRHCGKPLVQTSATDDDYGSRALRCVDCDQIDPLKLPANKAWIEGELRPPR